MTKKQIDSSRRKKAHESGSTPVNEFELMWSCAKLVRDPYLMKKSEESTTMRDYKKELEGTHTKHYLKAVIIA